MARRHIRRRTLSVALAAGLIAHMASRVAVAAPLPQGLARQAAVLGSADVIAEFDVAAIDADLARRRTSLPGLVADDALLSVARTRYAAAKAVVRRDLGADAPSVLRDYSELPMQFVRASPGALARLATHPGVRAIHENVLSQRVDAESYALVGQPAAAAVGYGGAGTTVAVIDDGIDITDPAFGGCTAPNTPAACRVAAVVGIVASPDASVMHGTNVAATVAGLARQARVASLDVFSSSGASASDIIAAINWSISNRSTYNIAAINMSLGDASHFTSPCSAANPYGTPVANANAAGITVVAAAGNAAFVNGVFQPGLASPACTPGVLAVGAVYDAAFGGITWGAAPNTCSDAAPMADRITCFSQSASYLSLLAPGALITAGGSTLGGTSQAAPHVAAAAAVLRAAFPSETLAMTAARLKTSSVRLVDGRSGVTTPRLSLKDAARPTNDDFASAAGVTGLAATASGTNRLATVEVGELGSKSVWWVWTAPSAGQVTLSSDTSDFATTLEVSTGSALAARAVLAEAASSSLRFQAAAGTTYRWRVDGLNGAEGTVGLRWSVNASALADMAVTLDGPSVVSAGQPFTVLLRASNAGPQAATRATASLVLPTGVSYVAGSPACSMTGTTLRCAAGELAAGAAASWSLALNADLAASPLVLHAIAASDVPDTVASNNSASLQVAVTGGVPSGDADVPLPAWAVAALALMLGATLRRQASGPRRG